MGLNPCETCVSPCPYRLFIDCPDWLAWAAAKNLADAMDEEGHYGLDTP